LNVAGALQDPFLTLYKGQQPFTSNDNWQSHQAALIEASGFAPGDPREAAVLLTLEPGPYTAIVTVASGASGVAIVEAFELDQPEIPLAGISTRGPVLLEDNVLIAGFVIEGESPRTVIV